MDYWGIWDKNLMQFIEWKKGVLGKGFKKKDDRYHMKSAHCANLCNGRTDKVINI